jgi:hypothetical protein
MMDRTIEAYRELLEAAQKVLAVPALRENGGKISESELRKRKLRLEAAAQNLIKESDLDEKRVPQPAQLQLV